VTPVVLNVGFYNFVASDKILALVRSDSAPMRRMVQEARKSGTLIDATQGRKTKSVLFLSGGLTVTSALSQETLARRLGGKEAQPLAGGKDDAVLAAQEEKEVEEDG
jgi:extracellular matrix regulatory protein A